MRQLQHTFMEDLCTVQHICIAVLSTDGAEKLNDRLLKLRAADSRIVLENM